MALNPSWYPLEAKNEGSEIMDEESKNIAAASVANRRLGSPMEGSTIRCISSHGELEVSDSRYYVHRNKPEDVERYSGQSGRSCYPETDTQPFISVPMERYLNSNIHDNIFVGFDDRGSDARGVSRSLRSKIDSKWSDEPGKTSSSFQPRLDSILPTRAPPYKPRGKDSTATRRRRPLSIEERVATNATRKAGACASCRKKHVKVIRTPYWSMNPVTYT